MSDIGQLDVNVSVHLLKPTVVLQSQSIAIRKIWLLIPYRRTSAYCGVQDRIWLVGSACLKLCYF